MRYKNNYLKKVSLKILIIMMLLLHHRLYSQTSDGEERITDAENKSARNISWILMQLLPSPVWLDDRNQQTGSSSLNFAFRWQITPINISFSTNKYVSPVQFFFVNPMRRYTGSVEFFIQPELATATMSNSGYNKTGLGIGSRINIPVKNYGEHLYVSLGGKYNFRKSNIENKNGYYGIEGGVYALFGILGFQFNYNFDKNSKYNFGLYIKYW